ncbi:hypothetical protein ACFFX0_22635 [Citricoccus parietis]|uniref:Uncharacterized protein n=1 Tax=Citricoccus parietis TaxID=592307 RepID=A0ABV5G4I3_9MICC
MPRPGQSGPSTAREHRLTPPPAPRHLSTGSAGAGVKLTSRGCPCPDRGGSCRGPGVHPSSGPVRSCCPGPCSGCRPRRAPRRHRAVRPRESGCGPRTATDRR